MSADRLHNVQVAPIPAWISAERLLGPAFSVELVVDGTQVTRVGRARLSRADAADLQARLRGVGLDGRKLVVEVTPPLHRAEVRKARLADARRRRDVTVGFSRPGVQVDDEGRISLTPDALALELGEHGRGLRVIDAGCGVGGNAIGFARAGARVVAIERDPARACMAAHNARVYGVADRIDVIEGDAVEVLPTLQADLLFLDPPWGRDWDRTRTTLASLPLLAAVLPISGHLLRKLIKVPPSFEVASLPGARAQAVFGVGPGDNRRVKFVCLTLGA